MAAPARCTVCQKVLGVYSCNVCDGKGYKRRWLFWKRTCPFCQGRGYRRRCPDEFAHILRDLAAARKPLAPRQKKPSVPVPRPPQATPRTPPPFNPYMLPPWDARYPNPWHPNHPRHPHFPK